MIASSARVMIVSHNEISGLPVGRHQEGCAVAYSKHPGFTTLFNAIIGLFAAGELSFERRKVCWHEVPQAPQPRKYGDWFVKDLPTIEVAYIFVDHRTARSAISFVSKLQDLGIQVHLVMCEDCGLDVKDRVSQELRTPIIQSACDGQETCGNLFKQHASSHVLETV